VQLKLWALWVTTTRSTARCTAINVCRCALYHSPLDWFYLEGHGYTQTAERTVLVFLACIGGVNRRKHWHSTVSRQPCTISREVWRYRCTAVSMHGALFCHGGRRRIRNAIEPFVWRRFRPLSPTADTPNWCDESPRDEADFSMHIKTFSRAAVQWIAFCCACTASALRDASHATEGRHFLMRMDTENVIICLLRLNKLDRLVKCKFGWQLLTHK